MRVPCHNCTIRHSGCHSSCKDYAEYRKIMDIKHADERRESMLDEYDVEAKRKLGRL